MERSLLSLERAGPGGRSQPLLVIRFAGRAEEGQIEPLSKKEKMKTKTTRKYENEARFGVKNEEKRRVVFVVVDARAFQKRKRRITYLIWVDLVRIRVSRL